MAETQRPSTPPQRQHAAAMDITPEQVRRMEESRLRAKALQKQQQAESARRTSGQYPAPAQLAGQKRSHPSSVPPTSRNATNAATPGPQGLGAAQDNGVRAAKKFQKYVEYDFSKMTDTKGGFMTAEDDPHNKALRAPDEENKPSGMSLQEWEQQLLRKRLRETRAGPYEPGLSVLNDLGKAAKCRDCGTLEIDWYWKETFKTEVCNTCKNANPEKYSLLTKTEAKTDYLLTDPELNDIELLPRMLKPNPHKKTWNDMMLFLRYQVEEYAFSDKKWGSAEALDEAFEQREAAKKQKKQKNFEKKLSELKRRTRVEATKRARAGGGGTFGDVIGNARHEHEWGRGVEDPETGMIKRTCIDCGMETEELEF